MLPNAAAALLAALNSSSFAQSPADHEAHHPQQQNAAPAPAQPAPPASQSGTGQGMMGGGMMNMMGGNMPMMMGARQSDLTANKTDKLVAVPAGFEPATRGVEIRYSIQLSYGTRSGAAYTIECKNFLFRRSKPEPISRTARQRAG
jgi:hypothetical protein